MPFDTGKRPRKNGEICKNLYFSGEGVNKFRGNGLAPTTAGVVEPGLPKYLMDRYKI